MTAQVAGEVWRCVAVVEVSGPAGTVAVAWMLGMLFLVAGALAALALARR